MDRIMTVYLSHSDIIAACKNSDLARSLSDVLGRPISEKRIGGWRLRDSIPGGFFVAVEAAAARLGIDGVTVALLADLAAIRPADPDPGGPREPGGVHPPASPGSTLSVAASPEAGA